MRASDNTRSEDGSGTSRNRATILSSPRIICANPDKTLILLTKYNPSASRDLLSPDSDKASLSFVELAIQSLRRAVFEILNGAFVFRALAVACVLLMTLDKIFMATFMLFGGYPPVLVAVVGFVTLGPVYGSLLQSLRHAGKSMGSSSSTESHSEFQTSEFQTYEQDDSLRRLTPRSEFNASQEARIGVIYYLDCFCDASMCACVVLLMLSLVDRFNVVTFSAHLAIMLYARYVQYGIVSAMNASEWSLDYESSRMLEDSTIVGA